MKSKHVKSEMRRPLEAKEERAAQRRLKKIPKNKNVDIQEKVDNTKYRKEVLKANKARRPVKYTPADKKVGKTVYD